MLIAIVLQRFLLLPTTILMDMLTVMVTWGLMAVLLDFMIAVKLVMKLKSRKTRSRLQIDLDGEHIEHYTCLLQ